MADDVGDWDAERHATGIDVVDEQHRRMFGLLADLQRAIDAGDDLGELLAEIERETERHFSEEESLMRSCGYADECNACFDDHHTAHADFSAWVSEIRTNYESGDPIEPAVVEYARNWIDAHVAGDQDQHLGKYCGPD